MNKILLAMSVIIFSNISHASEKYDIETFCQDLNVILQRVQIYSFNISNHQSTRTSDGGHFKRRIISNCKKGHCKISIDDSSPIEKYQPGHPDSSPEGYVAYPSFSIHEEKAKLIKAKNAYDLVIGNIPVKPINLLKGNKFDRCFNNYKFFKEQFDFQSYLGR